MLASAQVSIARLLYPFTTVLVSALADENRSTPSMERMRFRVVIHAGHMIPDHHGQAGASLIHAARLLNARATRSALKSNQGASAVVIVSDGLYDGIVRHGYAGIDPAGWRPIRVRAKETTARAWIHVPGGEAPPPFTSVAGTTERLSPL